MLDMSNEGRDGAYSTVSTFGLRLEAEGGTFDVGETLLTFKLVREPRECCAL